MGEKKACIIVSFPINKVQRPQRRHSENFFMGLYVDHLSFLDCTSSPLAEGPDLAASLFAAAIQSRFNELGRYY